jgi:hypothetical protein
MKIKPILIILTSVWINSHILGQTEYENLKSRSMDEAITYSEYSPARLASSITSPPEAPYAEGICILIKLEPQEAWVYNNKHVVASSPITTGKKGKDTPQGDFFVINKHKDWVSTIYHRDMPFFLRLNPGDFGLHQGVLSKDPSSHGCIRLPAGAAEQFFELCPIGTKVRITE